MDSDDGGSLGGTASTDTSLLIRELEVLNVDGSAAGTGPIIPNQSFGSDTSKVSVSGDGPTLPQALQIMRGTRPGQIINVGENEEETSVSIYSPEVEVYVAPSSGSFGEKSSGSNKVKVTPMVNHVWERKYYHGNLLAVHRDGSYLAYVLKGKSGGIVRVVSRQTASRSLIKCFSGAVVDLGFALCDDMLLACVDETGSLYVFNILKDGDNILTQQILHVEKESFDIESEFRCFTRLIWCPFMHEEGSEDQPTSSAAKTLVLLYGSEAEIWDVEGVNKQHGVGPVSSKTVDRGLLTIRPDDPHTPVVNAAFAPDGSAIAVAYYTGQVKFFLVDLTAHDAPECMYDWKPHDGHPVTSLYFLDNHKQLISEQQLWKFALTGARYNTEIKIWTCETWSCIQTIRFNSPISQPELKLQLKSEIDVTSKYFVLTDVNSKVLYVIQIHQDYNRGTAHVSSLSSFSLARPCISFDIFDAQIRKFKRSANDSHLDEITTGELDSELDNKDLTEGVLDGTTSVGVQIKMMALDTGSLQEMLIRYRPETSVDVAFAPSISSASQEESGMRDMLSDISMDQSDASHDTSSAHLDTSHLALNPAMLTSSPSASKFLGHVASECTPLSASSTSSFTHVTGLNEELLMDSPLSSVVDPSTILSPTSSHVQSCPGVKLTPKANLSLSDFPLPPITSSEEDELATPKTSVCGSQNGSMLHSANQSLNLSSRSNHPSQDLLEEMFSGSGKMAGTGSSLESASSTQSFHVRHLEDQYDANDQEVAETLGLEEEDNDDIEEDLGRSIEAGENQHTPLPGGSLQEAGDLTAGMEWPEPPDVSTAAKRLVSQAIAQGTQEEDDDGYMEKEQDFDDDENDEAEVEEIIQQNGSKGKVCRPEDDDALPSGNSSGNSSFSKRQHVRVRPEAEQVPMAALDGLQDKMAGLLQQMSLQQDMLVTLQQELCAQKELQVQLHRQQLEQHQLQQVASRQPSLEQDIGKLEDLLVSRMEFSLGQHMQKETQRLQDSLSKTDTLRKERDTSLHHSLLKEVGKSVKDTVSNTLKTEIKQTVNPALHHFVEPMKERIHQEVAHRLTACDSLLKDNIAKAVKSRSTMDVLASSIGDVIYTQLQQAYTDTFKVALLPSFKSAMEKTVQDLNGIFQQGTKEYQLYLRQNVDLMLKESGAMEEIVKRMEGSEKQFVQSVSHMKNLMLKSVKEELGGQMGQALSGFRDEMMMEVRHVVKEEVSSALKEHGASIGDKLNTFLRSGAATPVPVSSEEEISKEKILREMRSKRFNEAFQSALTAGNLELVVFACESANPFQIFSATPCPLSQPVLLSLISQLSASMDKQFDLKMKYLTDAVMNLDPSQPTTSEHIPGVLGALIQRLNSSQAHGGDPRRVKEVKMLTMAAKSMVS